MKNKLKIHLKKTNEPHSKMYCGLVQGNLKGRIANNTTTDLSYFNTNPCLNCKRIRDNLTP